MSAVELDRVTVVDARDEAQCPPLTLVDGAGEARAVIWPGMGARDRSMARVRLEPGSATVALSHPGEAVWYVAEGGGAVADTGDGSEQEVVQGSMVHVGPGDGYRFVAGDDGATLVGGPCPADPALYEEA